MRLQQAARIPRCQMLSPEPRRHKAESRRRCHPKSSSPTAPSRKSHGNRGRDQRHGDQQQRQCDQRMELHGKGVCLQAEGPGRLILPGRSKKGMVSGRASLSWTNSGARLVLISIRSSRSGPCRPSERRRPADPIAVAQAGALRHPFARRCRLRVERTKTRRPSCGPLPAMRLGADDGDAVLVALPSQGMRTSKSLLTCSDRRPSFDLLRPGQRVRAERIDDRQPRGCRSACWRRRTAPGTARPKRRPSGR